MTGNGTGKRLVAYFSASGVTARAARALAQAARADLFEIVPEEPYTTADLDWRNRRSRSSLEERDPSVRPAVASTVGDIDAYDTVFVGFPIWWGHEPAIVDTFLEQYDFSGKAVVPFATSGGSGAGGSDRRLRAACPTADVLLPAKLVKGMGAGALGAWAASVVR
ncbi:MAG TPA: NAD(P)H-dependent oxidoreductase [Candidatus Olsenella pullicola]|nr:NAD(P)H-dependent oxidoreductase [Candidatus Olsenella pullicola]